MYNQNLPIYGYDKNLDLTVDPLAVYGTEKSQLLDLEEDRPELAEILSESFALEKIASSLGSSE